MTHEIISAPEAETCADPLLSTASSLMTLGVSPRDTNVELRDRIAQTLAHHVLKIERDDFSGMEMLLTCQAQILHRIFTQAAEKYAGSDASHPHQGMIALTAQNYCRLTVDTLKQLKNRNSARQKRGTTYYKEDSHEALDT